MKTQNELRLDQALVERGLVNTRNRAKLSVNAGLVRVNGKIATKPNQTVSDGDYIELIEDISLKYVSRAAQKLVFALDIFELDVEGCRALDLGASTGGFTQVLLERGVQHVTAVDVGHGQLDESVAGDKRVTSIERLNVKDLEPSHLQYAPDLIVSDLSFISLKKALPAALDLAAPKARLIALIKPQFEVGKAHIGKGGIVKDEARVGEILEDIPRWLAQTYNARLKGPLPSPIKGGDGNQEYLILAELP